MFLEREHMNKGGVNRETPKGRPPAPPAPKPKEDKMKVIDELIKYANGEPLLRKAKLDNGVIFEYNGDSIVRQIIEKYGICTDVLNAKLEPIEEDTFEVIGELCYNTKEFEDDVVKIEYQNKTMKIGKVIVELSTKIDALIKNQKKIISKLDKESDE